MVCLFLPAIYIKLETLLAFQKSVAVDERPAESYYRYPNLGKISIELKTFTNDTSMAGLIEQSFTMTADECKQHYEGRSIAKMLQEKLVREICKSRNTAPGRKKRWLSPNNATQTYGVVSPHIKNLPQVDYPADGINRGYPNLYIYDTHDKAMVRFSAKFGQAALMRHYTKLNDVVLLVHGWHALQSSRYTVFEPLLKAHTIMTPDVSVIYVEWEKQGANDAEIGNAAWAATRLNLKEFLTEIKSSNLHCVGHSLGAHACAAICRQYRMINHFQRQCKRIVGLDPASVMFKNDSPNKDVSKYRLNKMDADYVAALMTNRQFTGLADAIGDEYITTNIEGWNSEACPALGKFYGNICVQNARGAKHCENIDLGTLFNSYVIPHTKDTCSHMMAVVYFHRMLDANTSILLFRLPSKSPKFLKDFSLSAWNSYVVGRDYRLNNFYDSDTVWYSFTVTAAVEPTDLVLIVSDDKSKVTFPNSQHSYQQKSDRYALHLFVIPPTQQNTIAIEAQREPVLVVRLKGAGLSNPIIRATYHHCVSAEGKNKWICARNSTQDIEVERKNLIDSQSRHKCQVRPSPLSREIIKNEIRQNKNEKFQVIFPITLDISSIQLSFVNTSHCSNGSTLLLTMFWKGCDDFFPKYGVEYRFSKEFSTLELRLTYAGHYDLKTYFTMGAHATYDIFISPNSSEADTELNRKMFPYGSTSPVNRSCAPEPVEPFTVDVTSPAAITLRQPNADDTSTGSVVLVTIVVATIAVLIVVAAIYTKRLLKKSHSPLLTDL